MPNQTAKGTSLIEWPVHIHIKGPCLCWLYPSRPLWLLTVQLNINSDCDQHCVEILRLHKFKEHCHCLSSKSSEETLTWTHVLYFQPHFALNVNLMHPWFHRNCKEDMYFEIILLHFYCCLHLPLKPLWLS